MSGLSDTGIAGICLVPGCVEFGQQHGGRPHRPEPERWTAEQVEELNQALAEVLDGDEQEGPVEPVVAGLKQDLGDWWAETARQDLEGFWPKLREYGAHDLLTVGASMMPSGTDAQRSEAGIAFYLLGKAARAVGAYQEGREPSEDTLLDLTVYSMMLRRVRATGELS